MAADKFNVSSETHPAKGVAIVRVGGHLDAHSYERLDAALGKLFEQNQYKIVVDLSRVEYVSSAGAGVFIGALLDAQEHQGNVVLLKPAPNVREVLELLGLTQVFQVMEQEEAALAAF